MNTFYLYSEERGVKWYRCRNCGAIQRGTPPPVCPVCRDHARITCDADVTGVDSALERLEEIMRKFRRDDNDNV